MSKLIVFKRMHEINLTKFGKLIVSLHIHTNFSCYYTSVIDTCDIVLQINTQEILKDVNDLDNRDILNFQFKNNQGDLGDINAMVCINRILSIHNTTGHYYKRSKQEKMDFVLTTPDLIVDFNNFYWDLVE